MRRRFVGIVWKRSDFRESSRIVSVWTRDRGRVHALGKGAHRPNSVLLGKIDFLNRVEIELGGKGNLPILARARLLHEPRALRLPGRFLAATYVADLLDRVLGAEQIDPVAYDLCDGGLTLVETVRPAALPTVLAGVELRLLAHLGSLPSLTACSQCGAAFSRERLPRVHAESDGVFCPRHAPRGAGGVPRGTLQALELVRATPANAWDGVERPAAFGSAVGLLARWLARALDRLPASRSRALTFLAREQQRAERELPSGA